MARRENVAELKIGPFSGGINRHSDGSAISDNELVDCVNFDIDLDGSLKSRYPWTLLNAALPQTSAAANLPTCRQLILLTGVFGGNRFIIYYTSAFDVNGQVRIYYVDGANAGQTFFIATGVYYRAVRYTDSIFIVPNINSSAVGVRYDLSTGTVTNLPNMPEGYAVAVYKDRLWISGRRGVNTGLTSRLYFSNLGNFNNWTVSDFFDIYPGDGDAVNELIVYQDNLLIFKDSATYVLTYDTQPAAASLILANGSIGAQGPFTVAAYEDSIFIQMHNQVYEMSNFAFTLVSVKVPFELDTTVPLDGTYGNANQYWAWAIFMSLVGDKLVCRFYNRIYVYHLRLRSWSRYESKDTNVAYLGPIVELDRTNTGTIRGWKTYVATSALWYSMDKQGNGSTGAWKIYDKIFYMEERYDPDNIEDGNSKNGSTLPVDIECWIQTKIYDVGISHRFKRLMHWGVDCITGRSITGTLLPFSAAYRVTWDQLHLIQWHNLNTWDYPLFEIPETTQVQPTLGAKIREFVRFPKSLRFRLLQFKVNMLTSGNETDGPARLYSITAFVSQKQLVSKAVN